MKFLVVEHDSTFHAGLLGATLIDLGASYDVINFKDNISPPSLENYAGIVVLGGNEQVWEDVKYPWLGAEKTFIEDAVIKQEMPYFGICLGHQLLADVTGGRVEPLKTPLIGVNSTDLTLNGETDPLFSGLMSSSHKVNPYSEAFYCLRWNSSGVSMLPASGKSLAVCDNGMIQAMRVGNLAYGVQGHIEVMPTDIDAWAKIPELNAIAKKLNGSAAIEEIKRDLVKNRYGIERGTKIIVKNFIRQIQKMDVRSGQSLHVHDAL